MNGIADVLYDAYNRHDAAAVAKLCDADGTHEDIAMGHSRVGQTTIADGLEKFFGWFPDAHWAPYVRIADPFGSVRSRTSLRQLCRRKWAARLRVVKEFHCEGSRVACA